MITRIPPGRAFLANMQTGEVKAVVVTSCNRDTVCFMSDPEKEVTIDGVYYSVRNTEAAARAVVLENLESISNKYAQQAEYSRQHRQQVADKYVEIDRLRETTDE